MSMDERMAGFHNKSSKPDCEDTTTKQTLASVDKDFCAGCDNE